MTLYRYEVGVTDVYKGKRDIKVGQQCGKDEQQLVSRHCESSDSLVFAGFTTQDV